MHGLRHAGDPGQLISLDVLDDGAPAGTTVDDALVDAHVAGGTVCAVSTAEGAGVRVWRVAPSGTTEAQLPDAAAPAHVRVAPDGACIAFVTVPRFVDDASGARLVRVPAEGGVAWALPLGPFDRPGGLAVRDDGVIYVASAAHSNGPVARFRRVSPGGAVELERQAQGDAVPQGMVLSANDPSATELVVTASCRGSVLATPGPNDRRVPCWLTLEDVVPAAVQRLEGTRTAGRLIPLRRDDGALVFAGRTAGALDAGAAGVVPANLGHAGIVATVVDDAVADARWLPATLASSVNDAAIDGDDVVLLASWTGALALADGTSLTADGTGLALLALADASPLEVAAPPIAPSAAALRTVVTDPSSSVPHAAPLADGAWLLAFGAPPGAEARDASGAPLFTASGADTDIALAVRDASGALTSVEHFDSGGDDVLLALARADDGTLCLADDGAVRLRTPGRSDASVAYVPLPNDPVALGAAPGACVFARLNLDGVGADIDVMDEAGVTTRVTTTLESGVAFVSLDAVASSVDVVLGADFAGAVAPADAPDDAVTFEQPSVVLARAIGGALSASSVRGGGTLRARDAVALGDGSFVIVGNASTFVAPDGALIDAGVAGAFAMRLFVDGTIAWARALRSDAGPLTATAVTSDGVSVWVGGTTAGDAELAPGVVVPGYGLGSLYVAELDLDGAVRGARWLEASIEARIELSAGPAGPMLALTGLDVALPGLTIAAPDAGGQHVFVELAALPEIRAP